MVEATLPMAVSLKWVAYACRLAGAAKPKWSREHATWTTTTQSADGKLETIVITAPAANRVRVKADDAHAHAIVAGLFQGMRWAEKQRRSN